MWSVVEKRDALIQMRIFVFLHPGSTLDYPTGVRCRSLFLEGMVRFAHRFYRTRRAGIRGCEFKYTQIFAVHADINALQVVIFCRHNSMKR